MGTMVNFRIIKEMNLFLKQVGTVFVALLILDAIWLTLRKQYHMSFFYSVQKSPLTLRWIPAVIVYILLATAITWVSLRNTRQLKDATIMGAAVGFVMYGFYDATNYATLSDWTGEMAIVDTLWGTIAGASAAAATFHFLKH